MNSRYFLHSPLLFLLHEPLTFEISMTRCPLCAPVPPSRGVPSVVKVWKVTAKGLDGRSSRWMALTVLVYIRMSQHRAKSKTNALNAAPGLEPTFVCILSSSA